jgi:hypothetical protein
MNFCTTCNNYLYIDLDEERNLVRYCKNCGYKKIEKKEDGSILVIDDNKIDNTTRFSQYLNKHIKHDHTLPRVNNIPCTNPSCTKKPDEDNEVIYLKYDFINMKYLYYCCKCDEYFRNK